MIPTIFDRRDVEFGLSHMSDNYGLVLCEAKAIFGTTLLEITVLALFYESVNRRRKTKEIEKKNKQTKHDNKSEKRNKTTKPLKIGAICGQNVWKFIFMLDCSVFETRKGISHRKVY